MAGLYIHIPFCKKACHYCDFHFSTDLSYTDRMVNAICTEIVLRKNEIKESVATIYFGGGTPSVLSKEQLEKILLTIRENYLIYQSPEITIEVNPDDIEESKLKDWLTLGVNRLSVGIQSFREKDLEWMNRSHSVDQSINAIPLARKMGFKNITIDLIYGIPGLIASDWKTNLQMAVNLNPDHISAYCLTIEPKTVFGHRHGKGEMPSIDDDNASDQFIEMRDFLAKNGFNQYEVSNFSKPGMESKHNSSYWEGKSYLGFGPSAHSYDGKYRRWNVSNNFSYLKGIENGENYFEEEELNTNERANESIMISLRTIKGLDFDVFKTNYGDEMTSDLMKKAVKYLNGGKLIHSANHLKASEEGLLLIDRICADLFF